MTNKIKDEELNKVAGGAGGMTFDDLVVGGIYYRKSQNYPGFVIPVNYEDVLVLVGNITAINGNNVTYNLTTYNYTRHKLYITNFKTDTVSKEEFINEFEYKIK